MKQKDDFEITVLDNPQKSKIRGGGVCTCSSHSTMKDDSVDELCEEGGIMVAFP